MTTKYAKPRWAIGQTTRASGLVEDVCEHGVGHPNAEWMRTRGKGRGYLAIHGCCGCCSRTGTKGGAERGQPGNVLVRVHRRGRPPGRTPEQRRRLSVALQLRASGSTWAEVGTALGITRQAASQLAKRARA